MPTSFKDTDNGKDYWQFGQTGADIQMTAGTTYELFNFVSTGACSGGAWNINQSETDPTGIPADYYTFITDGFGNAISAANSFESVNTASCVTAPPTLLCTTNTLSPATFTRFTQYYSR
jgi:hypothetical protein